MQAVQVATPTAPPLAVMDTVAASPAQLMMQAQQMGMTPETIGQMMDLQARHMREEAQRAYVRDFALFAAERPTVSKNKEVAFGSTKFSHATLDNLVDTISPVAASFGFAHSWNTKQEGKRVFVTCTLRHRLGHSESVTMEADFDSSGQKNSIQQMGSTFSYLRRYTYEAVMGVATKDEHDDNGKAAGSSNIVTDEPTQFVQEWVDYCNKSKSDPAAFRKACGEARAEFSRVRDTTGLKQFNNAIGH